jgi:hypothetical protein
MPSLSVQDATVGEFDGFVDLVVTLDTASTSTVDATAGNDSVTRLPAVRRTFHGRTRSSSARRRHDCGASGRRCRISWAI